MRGRSTGLEVLSKETEGAPKGRGGTELGRMGGPGERRVMPGRGGGSGLPSV